MKVIMNIFFALFLIVGTQAFAPSTVKKAPAVKALEYSTRYDNAVSYNRPSYSEGYGYGNRYGQSYGGSRGGLGNGYGYGDRSVSRNSYNLDVDTAENTAEVTAEVTRMSFLTIMIVTTAAVTTMATAMIVPTTSYNQGGYGGYNQRSYNRGGYGGYNQRSYNNRMGGYGGNNRGNGGYGRGYSMDNVRLEVDGLPSFHELYENQDYERQERRYDNAYSQQGRYYNRDRHDRSNGHYGQDYYGYNNNRNNRYNRYN
eukprot:CAMPEP_0194193718 /NCGR_PEP_ID=MMETSP0154-20130528/75190_1 /TAXON_ID=1049557 /ORGANISM="Thalassiothrix antarctica, Strain L6-D1" /LENGTH=255 /DNA_ID=CAMNT_0038918083 /DNA_START=115 /DNA_END=883 /DNA_ORIENTATION=+